ARAHALLLEYWPHLFFLASLVARVIAAVHAAMTKHAVRAAIGRVGVVLFSPFFGALLYFVAGINRIRRERMSQQRDESIPHSAGSAADFRIVDVVPSSAPQFASLKTRGDRVSRFPLVRGNAIRPLAGGDETYPAMIEAIQ